MTEWAGKLTTDLDSNSCWRFLHLGGENKNRWAGRTPRQRSWRPILPTDFCGGARRAPKTVILAGRALPARVDSRASSRPSPTNPNECWRGARHSPPPSTVFSMGEVGECARNAGIQQDFSRAHSHGGGVLTTDFRDMDSCWRFLYLGGAINKWWAEKASAHPTWRDAFSTCPTGLIHPNPLSASLSTLSKRHRRGFLAVSCLPVLN